MHTRSITHNVFKGDETRAPRIFQVATSPAVAGSCASRCCDADAVLDGGVNGRAFPLPLPFGLGSKVRLAEVGGGIGGALCSVCHDCIFGSVCENWRFWSGGDEVNGGSEG